jgi:DNA-binding CsgD family transcriptional regulator
MRFMTVSMGCPGGGSLYNGGTPGMIVSIVAGPVWRNQPSGVSAYAMRRTATGNRVAGLSADDYRRVLKAVERLGSADDFGSFPTRALGALMTAIDVDLASYAEVDLGSGLNRFLVLPDIDELDPASTDFARFARRFGNHPILAQRIMAGSAGQDSLKHFVRRLRLLGTVGNCCGEAALLLSLDLSGVPGRRRLVGIAVNRGIRNFDQHDAEVMAELKPHLAAAYRTALHMLERPEPTAPGAVVSGLPLTSRESQVLYWVSMGKTNDEVGSIVGARPLTVKKHLEHIYDKLGVPNRTAAASRFKAQAAWS